MRADLNVSTDDEIRDLANCLSNSLPAIADLRNTLVATGMFTSGLILSADLTAEERVMLVDTFCSILRRGVAPSLN